MSATVLRLPPTSVGKSSTAIERKRERVALHSHVVCFALPGSHQENITVVCSCYFTVLSTQSDIAVHILKLIVIIGHQFCSQPLGIRLRGI